MNAHTNPAELALVLHSGDVYHLIAADGTTVTVPGSTLAAAIRAVPVYKTEPEYLTACLDGIREDVPTAVEVLAKPWTA